MSALVLERYGQRMALLVLAVNLVNALSVEGMLTSLKSAERSLVRSGSAKPRLARLEARRGERVPTWLYRLWDQRTMLMMRTATKANLGVPDHILVESGG